MPDKIDIIGIYKKCHPNPGWHFSFPFPFGEGLDGAFYKLLILFTSFCIVLFASPNDIRIFGYQ